jgi:hypothetical protein
VNQTISQRQALVAAHRKHLKLVETQHLGISEKESAQLAHELAYGVGKAAPGALIFAYVTLWAWGLIGLYCVVELVRYFGVA